MDKIKIAIVEDDLTILVTCRDHINSQQDMLCVLSATSVEEFHVKLKPYHSIDILLLDIQLPGQSGLEAISALRKGFPSMEIIMFSVLEDQDKLLSALTLGASGYLLKSDPLETLCEQLRILRGGGALISPKMARHLIKYFTPPPATTHAPLDLQERDQQVLKLLAEGWSYEYIAKTLGITVDGVRYYIKKIYKKLNVNNKQGAIRKYQISQGIKPDEVMDTLEE